MYILVVLFPFLRARDSIDEVVNISDLYMATFDQGIIAFLFINTAREE